MRYDVVIVGGTVVDGTGRPSFPADVAIRGDTIEAVSSSIDASARTVIRAEGKVVAPGFIDTHSHADIVALEDLSYDHKLRQGVTTEVVGNCGLSFAPCSDSGRESLAHYVAPICGGLQPVLHWDSFRAFMDYARSREPLRQNLLPLVGHGTIRIAVMGFSPRRPSTAEMDRMRTLVREAMEAGAAGLSSGLVYPPGAYSDTGELIDLCRVVAEYGGLYATHMRNESRQLLGAIEEAITIGEVAGVTVVVSHLKSMGRPNWGKAEEALRLIDRSRARGIEVWADQYPYEANSTLLTALFPPAALEGGVDGLLLRLENPKEREALFDKIEGGDDGSWENFVLDAGGWSGVVVASAPGWPQMEGGKISELADRAGMSPRQLVAELVRRTEGNGTVVTFTLSASDVQAIACHPVVMVGSDGIPSGGKPHPREFGTFPRVLRVFVRERAWMTLEAAVHKMTGLPAKVFGLHDRGCVAPGYKADLVIFDADEIADRATYVQPRQYPVGVEAVLVNGKVALRRGELGEPGGRVLSRKTEGG